MSGQPTQTKTIRSPAPGGYEGRRVRRLRTVCPGRASWRRSWASAGPSCGTSWPRCGAGGLHHPPSRGGHHHQPACAQRPDTHGQRGGVPGHDTPERVRARSGLRPGGGRHGGREDRRPAADPGGDPGHPGHTAVHRRRQTPPSTARTWWRRPWPRGTIPSRTSSCPSSTSSSGSAGIYPYLDPDGRAGPPRPTPPWRRCSRCPWARPC